MKKEEIEKIKTATEEELREMEVPWLHSIEELNEYIQACIERTHTYGTCVYAMSMASLATFQYVAHKLGATGFQASCADLNFLMKSRRMKHGFRILDYEKILYPQYYYNSEHFPAARDILEQEKEYFIEEAKKKLEKTEKEYIHLDVIEHWKWIVSLENQKENKKIK